MIQFLITEMNEMQPVALNESGGVWDTWLTGWGPADEGEAVRLGDHWFCRNHCHNLPTESLVPARYMVK
ncbi:hypothetical protein [Levilactobacillus enshiensis]|uniref:hypothetical protein n=1 Tax=Levilactobacillus enshiensis TaxID=2590213 RepID=UPI00117B8BD3|nr:hypothetical protein [Levilactobacillus enshiensis]